MIFRKIRESFRSSNVSQLVVELLIVIAGVFIGIQVSNWNDERIERGRAHSYLDRISADLGTDMLNFQDRMAFWKKIYAYGELGLHYATTGDSHGTSEWGLLLAYFQASQLEEFYTASSTYDELKSIGALGLIGDLELRSQLARYYTGARNPVLTERPVYREMIRGLIPLHVQNYIWEQCYSTSSYDQSLVDCEAPISSEEAGALVREISKDERLVAALRYWMSTMRIAQLIGDGRKKTAMALQRKVNEVNQVIE